MTSPARNFFLRNKIFHIILLERRGKERVTNLRFDISDECPVVADICLVGACFSDTRVRELVQDEERDMFVQRYYWDMCLVHLHPLLQLY